MTDDLKAPERIWATEDAKNFGEDRFHTTRPMKGLTEYVRADLHATLEAEIEMLTGVGIIEVAIRNPSVADYMRHWEGRAEKAEAALADMTQQRDAAMAGVVKVRGLVWKEEPRNGWKIGVSHAEGYHLIRRDDGWHYGNHDGGVFDTIEAAKAAAQADYEACILSALTPDPARMLALTAAAYDLGIDDAATRYSVGANPDSWDYFSEAKAAILDLKSFPKERLSADALAALSRIEAQAEARGMLTERARWWQPEYPGQTEPVRVAWWRGQPEEGLSGFDTEHDRDAFQAGGPGPFIRRVTGNTFRQMPFTDATEAADKGEK